MHRVDVSNGGDIATLTTNDGASVRYHAIWLRDNAHDEHTRSPTNGQRLIALRDIPVDIAISDANISGNT